jgi:hypothetical protein
MDGSSKIDILLEEYKNGNDGYNSRDSMVPLEFIGMATILYALASLVISIEIFSYFIIVIGYAGFLFFLTMTIDITSTYISKQKISKRLKEIEKEINHYYRYYYGYKPLVTLWNCYIYNRERENIIEKIKVPYLFSICSLSFLVVWVYFISWKIYDLTRPSYNNIIIFLLCIGISIGIFFVLHKSHYKKWKMP